MIVQTSETQRYFDVLQRVQPIFVALRYNLNNNKMDKSKNHIKEVLEERGIKQTWLAEKLGKSFCIVNSYVCNRRQPSLEVLFEIAKILKVNPKELIDSKA